MKRISIILPLLLACTCCTSARVTEYKAKVVKEYDHDTSSYTQGLYFDGGQMYESTGQWGQSTFRQVDLATGKALKRIDFASKYFGEGSVRFGDDIYILTWTNNAAFVYDAATLKYKKTFRYPREGWGLTTDGKSLIASDGSSTLYYLGKDLRVEKTVKVTIDGHPLRNLNELEWIDGRIWANVYLTDVIVIINPSDGKVEAKVDCRGLLPDRLRAADTDVLNGIAYNPADGRIYVTGKYWPRLYEIKLEPKR